VLVRVKAVPGARREAIAGPLGDRIKVRVTAPPEGGRANRAVCALLAGALGRPARDARVVRGHASPEKTVLVVGADESRARAALL
jgi:uncharacterized protein